MSSDGTSSDKELQHLKRREAAKDLAKQLRRKAYERAKELSKAQRLERRNSPEAEERRLRLREQRRQAYLKAKESYKVKVEERKRQEHDRLRREEEEAQNLRHEELLAALTTADKLPPKPHLRLVRP